LIHTPEKEHTVFLGKSTSRALNKALSYLNDNAALKQKPLALPHIRS
jgi:hypothetical protein